MWQCGVECNEASSVALNTRALAAIGFTIIQEEDEGVYLVQVPDLIDKLLETGSPYYVAFTFEGLLFDVFIEQS